MPSEQLRDKLTRTAQQIKRDQEVAKLHSRIESLKTLGATTATATATTTPGGASIEKHRDALITSYHRQLDILLKTEASITAMKDSMQRSRQHQRQLLQQSQQQSAKRTGLAVADSGSLGGLSSGSQRTPPSPTDDAMPPADATTAIASPTSPAQSSPASSITLVQQEKAPIASTPLSTQSTGGGGGGGDPALEKYIKDTECKIQQLEQQNEHAIRQMRASLRRLQKAASQGDAAAYEYVLREESARNSAILQQMIAAKQPQLQQSSQTAQSQLQGRKQRSKSLNATGTGGGSNGSGKKKPNSSSAKQKGGKGNSDSSAATSRSTSSDKNKSSHDKKSSSKGKDATVIKKSAKVSLEAEPAQKRETKKQKEMEPQTLTSEQQTIAAQKIHARVLTINVDGSNWRNVGTAKKDGDMAKHLEQLLTSPRDADFLVVTEWSPQEELDKVLEKCRDYKLISAFSKGDKIGLLYNTAKWKSSGEKVESVEGKYVGVSFSHIESGATIIVIGVHMPHKNKKKTAFELFAKFIKEQDRNTPIIALGDWNSSPKKILENYLGAGVTPCFGQEAGASTQGTRKSKSYPIDNIFISKSVKLEKGSAKIRNDFTHYSHFPVEAELEITVRSPSRKAKPQAK